MEFHFVKQGKILTLSGAQRLLREQYITRLKEGTVVRETLTKTTVNKTHAQIKAIFGLAISFVIERFEEWGWDSSVILGGDIPTGVPVSKVLLKEYFYVMCPICDSDGNRITLSNKNVGIEEANKFFEEIRNLSAAKWQIVIPDPDPEWKKKQDET